MVVDKVRYQGTGSKPPELKGLQRSILLIPSQQPLKKPCFWTASCVYWEQVGVNRQAGGVSCDQVDWYKRIRLKATLFTPYFPEAASTGVLARLAFLLRY